jgi:novel protein kinase C epsilon type
MDWDLLEQRKVRPPFRPRVVSSQNDFSTQLFSNKFLFCHLQRSARDAVNFDTEFTREEPVLTPVPNDVVRCINQDEFAGFSFVNKEFGPERKICC